MTTQLVNVEAGLVPADSNRYAPQQTTNKQTNSVAFSLQANFTDLSCGRRLSAKLVPTFAGRVVLRGQRNGSLRPLIPVV
jgi:hypothetical protein